MPDTNSPALQKAYKDYHLQRELLNRALDNARYHAGRIAEHAATIVREGGEI